jgi:G3E family GTPase
MIPLSLITGFLGSGKTTLLKRIAGRRPKAGRLVVLVNEFSPLDVDGELVRRIAPDAVAIPGGSIFCRCLVTQFVQVLREIPSRFGGDEAIAGVVIEASGIADPRVVGDMLAETKLDEVYRLASIVCVVDPGTVCKLLATLPNIRSQIESAGVVVINKTDVYPPEQVDAAEQAVRGINPSTGMVRTSYCAADVELFEAVTTGELHGQYAPCADPNYEHHLLPFPEPVELASLTSELEALGDELYRAKGFVPTERGLVYVDASASGVDIEPRAAGSEGLAPALAVIAARGSSPRVANLGDRCRAAT